MIAHHHADDRQSLPDRRFLDWKESLSKKPLSKPHLRMIVLRYLPCSIFFFRKAWSQPRLKMAFFRKFRLFSQVKNSHSGTLVSQVDAMLDQRMGTKRKLQGDKAKEDLE